MNIISKLAMAPVSNNPQKTNEQNSPSLPPTTKGQSSSVSVPPSLSTTALAVPGALDTSTLGLSEPQLKRQSLEALVAVLKSLVTWGTGSSGTESAIPPTARSPAATTEGLRLDSATPDYTSKSSGSVDFARQPTPDVADDPTKFESAKQKKTTILEGIKKFNFKPKRVCTRIVHHNTFSVFLTHVFQGIQFFLETGLLPDSSPRTVARFLLETDGLSKAMIGEYLGEGYVVLYVLCTAKSLTFYPQ